MEENKDSKAETITIKKESLWKYATFILLAILIVGAVVFFNRSNATTTQAVGGNTGTTGSTGPVDLSAFTNNPSLYPSIGPNSASVTVVEFFDFQCPYCAISAGLSSFAMQYGTGQYSDLFQSAKKLEDLAKAGKIKFVYVPMSFLGTESVYAAEASYCANDQGKFAEMYSAIFAANDGQESNGKYSVANLEIIAQNITGLNQATFDQCLSSSKYAAQATQVNQESNSAGVQGTPTFYINGVKQAGWSTLSAALQSDGVSLS